MGMTPEEWAHQIDMAYVAHPDWRQEMWDEAAAVIRAAIAEERDACLRLVEAADGACPSGEEAPGILSAVAAAIRARASQIPLGQ